MAEPTQAALVANQSASPNPTITVESLLAEHVELDGCCIACGPCFTAASQHTATDTACKGYPCDTVKSLREAVEVYEENGLRYANEASIFGWSVITGACGECGVFGCHEGTCVVVGECCTLCKDCRRTQGAPDV